MVNMGIGSKITKYTNVIYSGRYRQGLGKDSLEKESPRSCGLKMELSRCSVLIKYLFGGLK